MTKRAGKPVGLVIIPEGVREALKQRAGNRCERCGAMVTPFHVSHRGPRGMGGSSRNHLRLSNLNLLCPRCHLERVERHPTLSLVDGWKVEQGIDPATKPFRSWRGWCFSDDDGNLSYPPMRHRLEHVIPKGWPNGG